MFHKSNDILKGTKGEYSSELSFNKRSDTADTMNHTGFDLKDSLLGVQGGSSEINGIR